MSNIIEVKGLTKKYGNFTAVDNISFNVVEGETFGILGPNGAGKTTTLEMIEGLKSITSGEVTLDGHDVIREPRVVKSLIGVQLQASSFFDGLNLVELIETFAAFYDRKVDGMKLLADVQLTEKAKNKVKELSGGQKQRLSIAVALVNDPKVIFLDEPTTGLDPQARRNLWDLITEIKKRGKTIVITTHYMEEAERLCDRIAIMDHAKIISMDTTQNLIRKTGITPSIDFRSSKEIDQNLLRTLPAVDRVVNHGSGYKLGTTNPQASLPALLSRATAAEFDVLDLRLSQPTLEDVFLQLTGHALRE